jgi:preprotein translocase subunit SecY
MYYLAPIRGPSDWIPDLVTADFTSLGVPAPAGWQIFLHVAADAALLILGGIVFALFWIETTGMGAKSVAEKIQRSGMQIPGFRRSKGSIERVMQRYIPEVTVIGGAFIGGLTLIASLLGTIGAAGGTGLLLTVSIMYRLYEDLASQQVMEMHPMMRTFFRAE